MAVIGKPEEEKLRDLKIRINRTARHGQTPPSMRDPGFSHLK
jgi:hypothetical protein